MLVIIGKCEKCGSPIFSNSFDPKDKSFTDAKLLRTCDCFAGNYVTVEEVRDGRAEEAHEGAEAPEA